MGQKVNPVGMRIGVNRDWNSRWYANDDKFSTYLNEDIKIRKYLQKECKAKNASLSHIEIERVKSDKGTNVTVLIFSARPAVIIGENGKIVNALTDEVKI